MVGEKMFPTSRYRTLWRQLEEMPVVKAEENRTLKYIAIALAELSGLSLRDSYRRIVPRGEAAEEQMKAIIALHERIGVKTLEELKQPATFAHAFLNWSPTDYQRGFLEDKAKQIVIRWSRQSGKTMAFAAKALHFCVTKPGSQAIIVAPGLRQASIVAERIHEHLNRMDLVAKRAWVEGEQRTVIRFHNRSRIKAFPYALHRLRGETSDLVFVDEAAFIPDDEVLFNNVLTPQMATR